MQLTGCYTMATARLRQGPGRGTSLGRPPQRREDRGDSSAFRSPRAGSGRRVFADGSERRSPALLWNGLSTPDLAGRLSARYQRCCRGWLGVGSRCGGGCCSLTPGAGVAVGSVEWDAPERSGSGNRHDAVRVSGSQLFSQMMIGGHIESDPAGARRRYDNPSRRHRSTQAGMSALRRTAHRWRRWPLRSEAFVSDLEIASGLPEERWLTCAPATAHRRSPADAPVLAGICATSRTGSGR